LAAQLDLEQEFAALGVQFKPHGTTRKALCCFHSETTPSLTIYPNDTFYCFGCMAWGDALNVRNYRLNGQLR
jgi:DNA primase